MSIRPGLAIGSTSGEVKTSKEALEIFWRHLLASDPIPMPALATGEVGDHMWSKRQLDSIGKLSQVKVLREGQFEETGHYIHAPLMLLRKGETITADDLQLFFTNRFDEADGAFRSFCKDKQVKIPQLVGINTLDILLLAFGWQPNAPTKLLDAFIERTRRETAEIWRKSNGNVVFLIESPMANILTNLTHGMKSLASWLLDALLRLVQALPKGAKWGLHFCFGRVGNKGMFGKLRKVVFRPKHTVTFLVLLMEHLKKHGAVPMFVHLPFRHGSYPPSTKPSDYRAYANLNLPSSVQVFAGAIDPKMDLQNQRGIYEMLDRVFGRTVGVAATCGYGSMTCRDMELSLARMHEIAQMP